MAESGHEGKKKLATRGEAPGRGRAVSRATVAPLVLEMEELTLWVMGRVAGFPRDHRFTMGDRLIESCLAVVDALVEASFTREKLGVLGAAARSLTRARTLVRLCNRAGLISHHQLDHFAERRMTDIGRGE